MSARAVMDEVDAGEDGRKGECEMFCCHSIDIRVMCEQRDIKQQKTRFLVNNILTRLRVCEAQRCCELMNTVRSNGYLWIVKQCTSLNRPLTIIFIID